MDSAYFNSDCHLRMLSARRIERYLGRRSIVQGPGAGPDITAGGMFADLLRFAFYLWVQLDLS